MAQVQGYKRIIVEDFEEKDRSLVSKISYNINNTFEEIVNALTKKLSITDNLNLNQRTVTVTVDSSGIPTATSQVASGLSSTTAGITVVRAQNLTTPSNYPTNTPFINFTDNSGLININQISGLQASQQYKLTIILWPS